MNTITLNTEQFTKDMETARMVKDREQVITSIKTLVTHGKITVNSARVMIQRLGQ